MKYVVALIVGTRPEAIKMAPVYAALKRSSELSPVLISTGQHREMLDQAFATFAIRPDFDLELMEPGQTLPQLTSRVVTKAAELFTTLAPAAVLVQGDTTTAMATAIAAFYARAQIGHVEAGLRTHNLGAPWPEEMNRRIIAPISRWSFAPTEVARDNLLAERISPERVHVTGNTVVDALLSTRDRLRQRGMDADEVSLRLGVPPAFAKRFLRNRDARWILVTAHRRESFGVGLERICEAVNQLTRDFADVGILYPVHLNPQVQEPVKRLLGDNPRVALASPAGYEDFIWLLDRCTFAMSDSGGVQEEAPSLGKPVLVLRDTTERPEGVSGGTCVLVGTDINRILGEASRLLGDPVEYARRAALKNPYGDGEASRRICEILTHDLVS